MKALVRVICLILGTTLAGPVTAQEFAAQDITPPLPYEEEIAPETLSAQERDDRITLTVCIGEHGPFDFLVDTGSEWTVISGRVAKQLGLVSDRQKKVISIAGQSDASSVLLDELVVGNTRIRDLDAAVINEWDIGAAGIIGIDSLRDQRITLDFDKNEITVAPSKGMMRAGNNEIIVRAHRKDKRLIVRRAYLDGRSIDIVIDTGASFTVGNRALRDRYYPDRPVVARTSITDVLGNTRKVDIINAGKLEIDRVVIDDSLIAIADTSVFEELGLTERPAILLGMNHLSLFKRIAVDFRRRQIAFELDEDQG